MTHHVSTSISPIDETAHKQNRQEMTPKSTRFQAYSLKLTKNFFLTPKWWLEVHVNEVLESKIVKNRNGKKNKEKTWHCRYVGAMWFKPWEGKDSDSWFTVKVSAKKVDIMRSASWIWHGHAFSHDFIYEKMLFLDSKLNPQLTTWSQFK